MLWFVYIIKSNNYKWHYVGSTNNINKRLKEHNLKKVTSTKYYAPFKLIFLKKFNTKKEARSCERKIKKIIGKESIIKKIK